MCRTRFTTVERLERIAKNALVGGYAEIRGHRRVHLLLAMDCEEPYGFTLHARDSSRHGKKVIPITVTGESRCRKCFSCKRRRSMFWTGRAITEYQQSARTLFCTLTMSVDEHLRLDYAAQKRLWDGVKKPDGTWKHLPQRISFGQLSPADLFSERARQFGFEVQGYLKRLRKGDADHVKPKLRYLAIAEMHDSDTTSDEMRGRPHFHLLIHEQDAGALVKGDPIRAIVEGRDGEYERRMVKTSRGWMPHAFVVDEAFIRKNWTLGFTKFQWASSANSAVYVCKYLTKALAVRVRASQHYGLRDFEKISQTNNTPKGQASLEEDSVNDDPQKRKLVVRAPADGLKGADSAATEL